MYSVRRHVCVRRLKVLSTADKVRHAAALVMFANSSLDDVCCQSIGPSLTSVDLENERGGRQSRF